MINTKTKISNIEFENCIMNASGPKCTNYKELDNLNNSDSSAVITKSSTTVFREGNSKPRYFDNEYGSINSMGLPNNGIDYYMNCPLSFKKPYIISISGLSLNENIVLLHKIFNYLENNQGKINGIEINLSCPNIAGKEQIAYSFNDLNIYLGNLFLVINNYKSKIAHKLFPIIGLKLPPYFELSHFEIVGNILIKYNIDFITTINSIPNGLIVDYENESTVIKPKYGIGGIGGDYAKPTALSNVYNFYKVFKKLNSDIKIIGCGGIKNGSDVFEFILCGATIVQLGTIYYKEDIKCFKRINNEFKNIMEKKKYNKITDFLGKIKVI